MQRSRFLSRPDRRGAKLAWTSSTDQPEKQRQIMLCMAAKVNRPGRAIVAFLSARI
jgi:hypothetical protein